MHALEGRDEITRGCYVHVKRFFSFTTNIEIMMYMALEGGTHSRSIGTSGPRH